jgi:hypothetical protein
VWDHSLNRLRVRVIYRGDDQQHLSKLTMGNVVDLQLKLPDGTTVLRCSGVVRFCRTRLNVQHVIRMTVEFDLCETFEK